MAVYKPCCGATPLAMASAMASGIATIPTVVPAIKSRKNRCRVYGSTLQLSRNALAKRSENRRLRWDIQKEKNPATKERRYSKRNQAALHSPKNLLPATPGGGGYDATPVAGRANKIGRAHV